MRRWPLRRGPALELALGLALLVLILSAVAASALARLAGATERYEATTKQSLEHLLLAERLRAGVEQSVAAKRGFLLGENPRFLQRMRQADTELEATLQSLTRGEHDTVAAAEVGAIERAHAAYRSVVDSVIQQKRHGAAPREVVALFERDLVPPRQRLDQVVDAFVKAKQARLAEANEEVVVGRRRALVVAAVTLGLGVLVAMALAVALGRHFARVYRRELEAHARAERATAVREEMVAIVAHDLRNPLSAIALRASTMRASGDERSVQNADAISRVVGGMERLLRSLLDAASIEAGRFVLRQASWPVDDLLRDLVEVFGTVAASSGLRLDCQPADANFILRADRERVFQVLSNLVGNALKFAPPAGLVTVAVSCEADQVHFRVADGGPGIDSEDLPHIFDRFWKREESRGGTGLGLYIARKVVEAHGGRIWAESIVGEGSVFHFTLPLHRPATGPVATAGNHPAVGVGRTATEHPV